MPEKNKDSLVNDLLLCISISENRFLVSLFPEKPESGGGPKTGAKGAAAAGGGGGGNQTTAGTKIRVRLNANPLFIFVRSFTH